MNPELEKTMVYFEPLKADLLWVKSANIFPYLFAEAFLPKDHQTSIPNFKKRYIDRLKRHNLKVEDIDEHILLVERELCVWITCQPVSEERLSLLAYLHNKKIARVGYVLRVADPPIWGRVQISKRHFLSTVERESQSGCFD